MRFSIGAVQPNNAAGTPIPLTPSDAACTQVVSGTSAPIYVSTAFLPFIKISSPTDDASGFADAITAWEEATSRVFF